MIRENGGDFVHDFKAFIKDEERGQQEIGSQSAKIAGESTEFSEIETTNLSSLLFGSASSGCSSTI